MRNCTRKGCGEVRIVRDTPWPTVEGVAAGLVALSLLGGCAGPEATAPPPPVPVFNAQSGYARVASEFLDGYLAAHPVEATLAGEHAHDARLPALFPGDLQRRAADVRAALTRLQNVSDRTLQDDERLDYRLMQRAMAAELLDLEEIGGWRRDPRRYTALLTRGTEPLVAGRHAPLQDRMRSMAGRWQAVPLVLRAARQNLDPGLVPPLLAERALEDLRSARTWIDRSVPASLEAQGAGGVEATLRSEWESARQAALASADSFALWLEHDLGPRATGDMRLGAPALGRFLEQEHHLTVSLQDLYALNRQAIEEYREWMGRVAMSVDPLRRPHDIVDSMTEATRGAAELIPSTLEREAAALGTPEPPTRARTVLWPASLRASWLHFLDQARLDDPALDDVSRLAGIRRALHGHALVHAMLALHTGEATLPEAAEDFENIALVDAGRAMREVQRVAYDPGAALPAIGRMQIFALRDRMRAEQGAGFDQREFSRRLLAFGLPVPLAAEAMLDRDPGRLLVPGVRTPGLPPLPGPLER